ncbi:hypothetical protein RhiTH_000417 [Rhizoctonia solani]
MADLEDKAPLVIEKGYPGSQLKDEASERVAWSVPTYRIQGKAMAWVQKQTEMGTNQPERTDVHTRELEKFILECEMFVEDVGTTSGPEIDAQVARFVRQFDAIEDRAIE